MADEQTKVEIGFGIGQVLSVKLSSGELTDLRKAVEAGKGWFDMRSQEGTVSLNLATVVFIRVDDAAHSIGFAG
jgi:hypothetical protein